jgi:hypothetical protein
MAFAKQGYSIHEALIMLKQVSQPKSVLVPAEKTRSAIESLFPHIARKLTALWHTSQISLYMDSLLLDNRGGRQGFPEEVLDELMCLSGTLWHLHHTGVVEDFQHPDAFSFAAAHRAEFRRCGTSGSWVLV